MAYTTIDDPSAHFTITLYTGNGADGRAITNSANAGDFQPDWLWYKERSSTSEHRSFDSSRGASKRIEPNNTNAEATDTTNHQSFDSNGFTIGNSGSTNANGDTYVAWQWKANGGTKTTFTESGNNPGGSYQVNTTAGFSILDYTGTGAVGTVAHGLGAVPEVMICKDRSSDGDDWFVYHVSTGNDGGCRLNTNGADGDDSNRWNDTTPTSSVCTFGASGGVNDDGKATTAYVWTPIQGYSKFGSYTGNADADGTFVYLGFSPSWIMIKRTDSTQQWNIHDSARREYNSNTKYVFANLSNAEATSSNLAMDFLSNGFKLRSADDAQNNGTYIYMAFAESPFVSSEGVPTTAR